MHQESTMENNLLPKWMIVILGFLLMIFLLFLILNQANSLMLSSQTLKISATGKVTSVPDVATVTIGVMTQGTTAEDTKNKNNQKINQVISFIKQQGINAEDIKTSRFDFSPRYDYINNQNAITGYQANQAVIVKVKNIDESQDQLEKILAGVIANGANQIQSLNFDFSDPEQLSISARKLAIAHAKQKAYELSKESHLKLGRLINVIETPTSNFRPMPFVSLNTAQAKSVAPNVEPGSQEVVESVDLIFEVRRY